MYISEAIYWSKSSPPPGIYTINERLTKVKSPTVIINPLKITKIKKKKGPSIYSYPNAAQISNSLKPRSIKVRIGANIENGAKNSEKETLIQRASRKKLFIPGVGTYTP